LIVFGSTCITVIGNLTDDPELRFSESGRAIARFSVAVNRRKKGPDGEWVDQDPSFHNVTAFGQLAENVAESFRRGQRVIVYGTIAQRHWQEDGDRRSTWQVVADDVGASAAYATVTARKVDRRTNDLPPDDPWASASSVSV
jgi:single-strand DNA-binding protein